MSYGNLLTKVFEFFKLKVNQQPNFQVSSTISDKTKRVIVPLPGFGEPPVIDLEANIVAAQNDPIPVVPVPRFNFEKEFAKLHEAHNELEVMFQSLQEYFHKVVAKQEVTEAKVRVLVILSNIVATAGRIEDGLSQMINVQLGLIDIPFLPLIKELAEPIVRVYVIDETAGTSGTADMEIDIANNQIVNNGGFAAMD